MKLIKSKNCNINYLAKVVNIKVFRKHLNPEVTKLKCYTIDGFNIITSIDAEPGLYIDFPTACCINPDFLSYNNLFRKSEKNNDPHKTGLFEDNGKVKAVKLRGELSEGFIVPAVEFTNWLISITNRDIELIDGTEFDTVEHEGKTFWVNKKFIVKGSQGTPGGSKKTRKVKKELDKVIPSQFRYHYETVIIKKCPNVIQPEDLISEKIHGTSHISAYVMCHEDWTKKFLDKLSNDKRFYMECKSPSCVNKVPHEGIVIKKEDMIGHAWKLKCFKFLDMSQTHPEMDLENEG